MKSFLIWCVKFYQKKISPLKKPCCRFRPTCSAYAIIAIKTHGAFKGSIMTIFRFLRCNPYFEGGYDPVPKKFSIFSQVGKFREPSVCDTCEKREECDRERCIL